MPLLDVALAFSLTMLLVASIVSAIAGGLQSLRGVRSKVLQKMLTLFISEEVVPVVNKKLKVLSDKADAEAARVITAAVQKLTPDHCTVTGNIKECVAVSRQDLIESLSRSDFGIELQKRFGNEGQAVLEELAVRFDAVGKRFTESFRNNARIWTTVIAITLALTLNIDSIFILDAYLTDADLRAAVIAQSESITTLSEAGGNKPSGDMNDQKDQPDQPGPDDLQKTVQSLQVQMKLLQSAGFPIGWNHYPYSHWMQKEASDGAPMIDDLEWTSRGGKNGMPRWFAGILLTGFLAGLGAPFWYDVVASLGRLIGRGRSSGSDQAAA